MERALLCLLLLTAALVDASRAAEAGADAGLAAYYRGLEGLMASHMIYPLAARRANREGTCRVRAAFLRSGEIVGVQLLESAGVPELDQECINVFQRVRRFPAVPDELNPATAQLLFETPFVFRVD